MYSKVKLGLYGRTAEDLIVFARNIVTSMTGNVSFPTPVDLAEISAAADALESATESALNGGRIQHLAKREAVEALRKLLRNEGAYVQSASDGDANKILSAGMLVNKKPQPVGVLPAPKDLLATVSNFEGAIDLDWARVDGGRSYTVYINSGDPNDDKAWTPVYATTKSRATITDLSPGTFYWFKVAANGAAGMGPVSDASRSVAA